MTNLIAGDRSRLVVDSMRHMIIGALQELGWLDSSRRHLPITVLAEPLNWDVPVEANLVAFAMQEETLREMEMGNPVLTRGEAARHVIVLAESESLGLHLAGDIRDILAGRMPQIGRVRSSFEVLDFGLPTPVPIGYALVDDVRMVEPPDHNKRDWLQHWYMIEAKITNDYDDDGFVPSSGPAPYPSMSTYPSNTLFPGSP
jgi:hypothetical protein